MEKIGRAATQKDETHYSLCTEISARSFFMSFVKNIRLSPIYREQAEEGGIRFLTALFQEPRCLECGRKQRLYLTKEKEEK